MKGTDMRRAIGAFVCGVAWALAQPVVSASADQPVGNLVVNPGFERGWLGWTPAWDRGGAELVVDAKRARGGRSALMLTATEANVGVDSRPLYAGVDFDPARTQVVSAYVGDLRLARGTFGLRLYCYDAGGKALAMKSLGARSAPTSAGRWQRLRATVGPGTDFAFPEKLDHVVVRFSLWSEDGRSEGQCLVDDVFFGRPVEGGRSTPRAWKRTPQGAVAIWRDTVPAGGAASDPAWLAGLLAEAGYGVNLLTSDALADGAVLDADRFDLLVMPYGASYPSPAAGLLLRFLRRGGHLIALGGRCFRRPLYRSPRGWTDRLAPASQTRPPRPMFELSERRAEALQSGLVKEGHAGTVSLGTDDDGQPALRMVVDELRSYSYVRFGVKGAPGDTVVCFRARGDAETRHLCVEINETDGSRWKAVVPLSTAWRRYALSTGEFVSYATPDRGRRGDYVRAERVVRIAFGFPSSLVGRGRRSFELSQVAWGTGAAPPEAIARDAMVPCERSDLVRAFGKDLKRPYGAGDITAFCRSEAFRDVRELRPAQGQHIFTASPAIEGGVSGWSATIVGDNANDLWKGRSSRTFLPTQRWARMVPLLVTPAGEPAASLFINVGGRYAGSQWACFGVTSRDLFPRNDRETGQAFVRLVDRMLRGAVFTGIGPRFSVRDGKVRMALVVSLADRTVDGGEVVLRAALRPGVGEAAWVEQARTVRLAPGRSEQISILDVDADRFDWKRFQAECRVVAGGQVIDRFETSLDVRRTLLAACDRFVRTQQQRGDGKFSGVGFVDNRGARALLATYDLTGRKEYLRAAIAWGKALVAEQRADGGYLMGYGYYADGNECYVADGGEIACGIARLVTYAPEPDRRLFMDSLRSYMRYRESFRCDGGGIGVGWCRRDYGARPIKPLDQTKKVFAPERNLYTIGCTLASATMYARLTGDARDNDAAVKDAHWWMARTDTVRGGAYVESAVWAHKYLSGGGIKAATEAFLRSKFIPNAVLPDRRWWTAGGGRTVQGIEGLAYYHDCIERDPKARAALMRATYHVCSPESLAGLPRVLSKEGLSGDEWRYVNFAAVSLPNLLASEITRKGF